MKIYFLLILAAISLSFKINAQNLAGAWEMTNANQQSSERVIMIATENYLSISVFEPNHFIRTYGGTYKILDNQLVVKWEFNDKFKEEVGTTTAYSFDFSGITFSIKNLEKTTWKQLDASMNTTSLAGNWRISSRETQDGNMTEMKPGPRKTIKIFSDSRFQWIAINTETKEFFGTGGGNYTLKDGIYTENIDFFSRDNQRVGMSLSFDAKVSNKTWQHSGKNSTGGKINEIWVKE